MKNELTSASSAWVSFKPSPMKGAVGLGLGRWRGLISPNPFVRLINNLLIQSKRRRDVFTVKSSPHRGYECKERCSLFVFWRRFGCKRINQLPKSAQNRRLNVKRSIQPIQLLIRWRAETLQDFRIHRSIVCLSSLGDLLANSRRESDDELFSCIGRIAGSIGCHEPIVVASCHRKNQWRFAIIDLASSMATRHNLHIWRLAIKGNIVKQVDEKYILRFEQPGHRKRIKQQAAQAKRSLNKQLLVLIEAGEKALHTKPTTKEST